MALLRLTGLRKYLQMQLMFLIANNLLDPVYTGAHQLEIISAVMLT